jgi:ligand-binding sensor domain-containing protein
LALLAAGLGVGAPPGASLRATGPAALPAGQWTTFANGDDVLTLAAEGPVLWAGTRAGGLVRWDTQSRSYTQFLRPQDPLPSNTLHDIAIGADGRKWLATDGGLTLLDDKGTAGRADDLWHTYTRENTAGGLPCNEVWAVQVDGPTVWVGTHQVWEPATERWVGGGLSRLDTRGTPPATDDSWAPVATFESTFRTQPTGPSTPGLVSDNINDILLTPKGNLWLATSPHWRLAAAAEDGAPPTWQRMYGGLSYLDTKGTPEQGDDVWAWTDCQNTRFTVTCDMRHLALDALGFAWATIRGRGVMYFRADESLIIDDDSRRFTLPDGPPGDTVEWVTFGPANVPALANTVWLGRAKGGFSVLNHNGTLRNLNDDEWNFGRPQSFTPADGLARERVQAILVSPQAAWVGTGPANGAAGGISELDLANLTFGPGLKTDKTLPMNFVTDLGFGAAGTRWQGHVWVATGSRTQRRFGAGVVDLDTRGTRLTSDDVWTPYTTLGTDRDRKPPWTGLMGDNVQAVETQGDWAWFGSTESTWNSTTRAYNDGGLTVFDGTTWTARQAVPPVATPGATPLPGLRHGSVSSLTLGCNGQLWIGTGNPWDALGEGVDVLTVGASVHRVEQDSWTPYSHPKDLASKNTTDIAVDCAGGVTWVSSAHHIENRGALIGGGVAVRRASATPEWVRYSSESGLESYADGNLKAEAMAVLAGPNGTAWVATYGTTQMSQSDLLEEKPYWPAVLNTWDGAAWQHTIFERAGWISSMARDDRGRLWLATTRGGTARESISPDVWRTDRDDGGLLVSDGEGWVRLDMAGTGLPSNDLSVVAIAPDGDIWIGTEGWGMARLAIGAAAPTPTPTSDGPTPTASPTGQATTEATPTIQPSISPTADSPTATATRAVSILYLPLARQRRVPGLPTATRGAGTGTAAPPTATATGTGAPSTPTQTPAIGTGTPPTATATQAVPVLYLPFTRQRREPGLPTATRRPQTATPEAPTATGAPPTGEPSPTAGTAGPATATAGTPGSATATSIRFSRAHRLYLPHARQRRAAR